MLDVGFGSTSTSDPMTATRYGLWCRFFLKNVKTAQDRSQLAKYAMNTIRPQKKFAEKDEKELLSSKAVKNLSKQFCTKQTFEL